MKAVASSKGVNGINNKNKKDLIDLILEKINNPVADTGTAFGNLVPFVELINQSFLHPQNDQDSQEETAIGLKNKIPFLQAFWDICKDHEVQQSASKFSCFKISFIY